MKYALSFTSGGLLVRECGLLVSLYLESRSWETVRVNVARGNLLQARTTASGERVLREALQRLRSLADDEIRMLADGSPTEQRHLLWVAICRRYELIGEFAEEILRERFLLMTFSLKHDDYEKFIIGKSLWHPELEDLKSSTRLKLRQTLFRMLHEAGLLSESDRIVPAVLSERIAETLRRRKPSDIRYFPTTAPA